MADKELGSQGTQPVVPRLVPRQESVEELKKKIEDYKNQIARLMADFRNFKIRLDKDRQDFLLYAYEGLLEKLLPVFDDFDRVIHYVQTNFSENDELRRGIELVKSGLEKVLASIGVTCIEAQGEKFNPQLHEAISMEQTDQHQPGTVIKVYQKGYMYRGRLLRPARVIVAAPVPKEKKQEPKDESQHPTEPNLELDTATETDIQLEQGEREVAESQIEESQKENEQSQKVELAEEKQRTEGTQSVPEKTKLAQSATESESEKLKPQGEAETDAEESVDDIWEFDDSAFDSDKEQK